MIFRQFSIVFEHRDQSRHRHRSNRRRKNDVRFLYRNVRRASKKLFGSRKPRCVDFIRQTLRKRNDFFDRFRSFSSTAIEGGIGIGRIGVEKTTFAISLLVGKRIANTKIFSNVFDRMSPCKSFKLLYLYA